MSQNIISIWIGLFLLVIIWFCIDKRYIQKTNVNDYLLKYMTVVVLFFSAPFVHYIITCESGIGFITVEHYDAWISFFGAIIGGSLTLFGVWWTIIEQQKSRKEDQRIHDLERKEELAIQYKPMLSLNFNNGLLVDSVIKNSVLMLMFSLENIGRGEAVNCKIECSKLDGYFTQIMNGEKNMIETGNKFDFNLCLVKAGEQIDENRFELLPFPEKEEIKFSIYVHIEDAFGNSYKTEYSINVDNSIVIDLTNVNSVTAQNGKVCADTMTESNKENLQFKWNARITKTTSVFTMKE